MAKVLIIDTDNGLESLASDERIEGVYGYRPRRFISATSVIEMFDRLFEHVVIQHEDQLGKCEEEVYRLKADFELDAIVLDSLSAYQSAKKREVRGSSDLVTLQMHGMIGEGVEDLITRLTRTNIAVIVTGHTKGDSENEMTVYKPALTGRMAVEINRHFDIVMHSLTTTSHNGNTKHVWQINADATRACKSRLQSVSEALSKTGGRMPQDYEQLMSLINAGGYVAPKILVLGDSGTGKTYSLRTLKKVEKFPKKDCTNAVKYVPKAQRLNFGAGNGNSAKKAASSGFFREKVKAKAK